jgi:flagellar motor switch/type III secretory pathway protein FliN
MTNTHDLAENHFQSKLNYSLPELEIITKNEVKFHNIIACKGRSILFQIEKRTLFLQLTTTSEQNKDFAGIWIKLLINQNFFWIGFSKYSFGALLGNCFLFDSLSDCPAEIRGAVIESTLTSLLNIIEDSTSSRIEIDTVAMQAPDTKTTRNVFFTLNKNGSSNTNGYFAFDETLMPFFSKMLENLPDTKIRKWNQLQTSIHFQIGSTTLTIGELQNLRCNDLIFIDDCPLLLDHILTIRVAPNLECEGTYKDKKLIIQTTMSEKMKEENSNVTDIDELQVNLVFDVGERSIQFQELKKIQPGYIFELDNLMVRPVTIRANGQSIGSGELLQTDEKIAVRVLELNQQSNG